MPTSNQDNVSAISRRLAKLREQPLNMSVFDAKLKALLPPDATGEHLQRSLRMRIGTFLSPLRAAAALLILASIAAAYLFLVSAQPVSASPQEMAAIYERAVADQDHTMAVSSIDEARAAIHRKWPKSPDFAAPGNMSVMSCCVHEVGKRQLGCVTFTVDGVPVMLAVADAKEICSPSGEARMISGERYVVASSNQVNMVMRQDNGVWTCLMGRLSIERLAEVAGSTRAERP